MLLNSLGSAEALTLALERPSTAPELLTRGYSQGVAEVAGGPPVHYIFGGFQTSGACIEWFRALFAAEVPHERLIADAEAVPAGCDGVTFVPDLRGRISPVPDPEARGAWFGLGADATAATLYRAVLEGLAFEARLTIDDLARLPGLHPIEQIRAIGGNTRNPLLLRIKASVYRRPIVAAEMAEATALGAALLGGLAAGIFPNLATALAGLTTENARRPAGDRLESTSYEAQYRAVYRPAYAALRPLHHAARRQDRGAGGPRSTSVDRLEIELQLIAATIEVLLHLEHDLGGRRDALVGPGLQPLAHRELERLALAPVAREPDRLLQALVDRPGERVEAGLGAVAVVDQDTAGWRRYSGRAARHRPRSCSARCPAGSARRASCRRRPGSPAAGRSRRPRSREPRAARSHSSRSTGAGGGGAAGGPRPSAGGRWRRSWRRRRRGCRLAGGQDQDDQPPERQPTGRGAQDREHARAPQRRSRSSTSQGAPRRSGQP